MSLMDFQDRLNQEALFEKWREDIKKDLGVAPAHTASSVFVWLIQTEDGRKCAPRIMEKIRRKMHEEVAEKEMTFCPHCDHPVWDEDARCINCRKDISDDR